MKYDIFADYDIISNFKCEVLQVYNQPAFILPKAYL